MYICVYILYMYLSSCVSVHVDIHIYIHVYNRLRMQMCVYSNTSITMQWYYVYHMLCISC